MIQSLPRSNPIAIKRNPGDGNKETYDSDIDDDDSDIDVEGDAIKLKRKYGEKVVQTYVQDSTMMHSSNNRMRDKTSVLNAPYLGSLSKSSNQVSSLPPMSLAGDDMYLGEPPESTVMGSLRDSHQRRRFMDGPASYRERHSGKICHLDHRLRFHGKQPELNIGERLQQSLLRKKEESRKLRGTTMGGEGEQERKPVASSLTAMMRDAPQSVNTVSLGGADAKEGYSSSIGHESLVPIRKENDHIASTLRKEPPAWNMLSTSLTAFELLKTSNAETISRSSNNFTDQSSSVERATESNHQQTAESRYEGGFQPLARSMSDPSPCFQSLSLSDNTSSRRVIPNLQTDGFETGMGQAIHQPSSRAAEDFVAQFRTELKNYPFVGGYGNERTLSLESQRQVNIFNDTSGHRSPQDHDPNTEGAFGDLDM
ncbi:unnamed protein product [Pseudo-nitzschia multistriata]|uniref:Uncharacterized protein n=1 Tax=Pseudo-nitzschia multistriata TaxID=183589 RepID=A0A448Z6P9_9STRA|nr:unnamed protein product [Pseudo-nitzschia multistriata]